MPVVADVINTPDLSTFSAYGVENCYQFHGYTLADVAQVGLPGGITGQAMSYTSQQFGSWSILYWIVPVKMGAATNYERVVLYVQNTGSGATVVGTDQVGGDQESVRLAVARAPTGLALINNRTFLVAYRPGADRGPGLTRRSPLRLRSLGPRAAPGWTRMTRLMSPAPTLFRAWASRLTRRGRRSGRRSSCSCVW